MAFEYFYGFPRYISAAERRRHATRELAKLTKKGQKLSPIVIDGRKIATTFWGEAWCENLERYSDFANRLGRGRSYVRNGLVVDLQVAPGRVTARVCGSELYDVTVDVAPVAKAKWQAICRDSAGAIDSVIELLQGRLSKNVMARLCQKSTGLFPAPAEIRMSCSCPDFAYMCKHLAATLYGIGARLDHEPALLFTLRKVKQEDLVAREGLGAGLTRRREPTTTSRAVLDEASLGEVFGLDLAPASVPGVRAQPADMRGVEVRRAAASAPAAGAPGSAVKPRRRSAGGTTGGSPVPKTPNPAKPARPKATGKLSAAERRRIAEQTRKRWAAVRKALRRSER